MQFQQELDSIQLLDSNKVLAHCLKVIDGMRKNHIKTNKIVSLTLGRILEDPYLGLSPEALYEVFPLLYEQVFKNSIKAMNFLKTYCFLIGSGLNYNISITLDELMRDIRDFSPVATASLKLYDLDEGFIKLPKEQRKAMLLKKEIIKKTIVDIIEPILETMQKESKLIVYGPSDVAKYTGYDALRSSFIEEKIFEKLKKFSKHPNLELRRDKNFRSMVNLLRSYCY